MFLLPYGHDQTVYGRQWIVAILIALNLVAFPVTYLLDRSASADLHVALREIDRIHETYPDARVPPQAVTALPGPLRRAVSEIVSDDPDDEDAPGAATLARATRRLVAAADGRTSARFGYRPGKASAISVVTSLFVHADLEHLLGNMLFLWLAGAVIECFWEPLPFFVLYLAAGLSGTAAHHLSAPESMVPLIGASGAIAGLMGAFVVGHPRTKIKLLYAAWLGRPLVGTLRVPAWVLLPAWLCLNLAFALLARRDGVAYWAHVGGFGAGLVGALIMRWGGWVSYDAAQVLGKPQGGG